MNEAEIMEYLFSKSGFVCFLVGFIFFMLSDCIFSIINFYVQRCINARDFRLGRLLPFDWLQDNDIRYFVARQIYDMDFKTGSVEIEKQDEILAHLKRKYIDINKTG